jgi:hypothetical protein
LGVAGRLEVRGRGWRFGLVASAVVVAAGAAAVGIWPHAWWWLVAVTAVVAAGMPVVLAALTAAQQRRADAEKVTRRGLVGTTGLTLPRVADTADGEARDAAEFATVLEQAKTGRYFCVAVVGYGADHDQTLSAYQKVADVNRHVRVVTFGGETNPRAIADGLVSLVSRGVSFFTL